MTSKITTETGIEMLRSVTPIYNEDDLALAIFEANGRVMEEIGVVIEGLKYELHPQNATWTLPYWEQMLKIKHKKKLTTAERVQVVLFELNKYFAVTKSQMEIIVNAFVEHKDAFIEDIDGEYAFQIIIPVNNKVGSGLRDAVEETKPAHLLAIYERVAEVGAIIITDDSYSYPVYYKTTGEFSGEKEFTQTDVGTIGVLDDSYDYEVEYPVSEKPFSQEELPPIKLADDSYSFIKPLPVTGEMETLSKGFTHAESGMFLQASQYDYKVQYPICGEFYTEGEDGA